MKFFTGLSLFVLVFTAAHAEQEVKTYSKTDSDTAQVVYKTGVDGVTQAAALVDGEQNQKFISDLLNDSSSKLAKLKAQIEKEICDENSTPESSHIDGCGEVELTAVVETSFGREGWAAAGAAYSFFVGFRADGTGHFYNANYLVRFSEFVEAMGEEGQEFDGTFLKTLTLNTITKLD